MALFKRKGTGTVLVGALLLASAVVLLVWGMSKDGVSVGEYDRWREDPGLSDGDSITVTATLNEEVSFEGDEGGFHAYTFEDSEHGFVCTEDVGDPGDTVTLELVYRDLVVQARSQVDLQMCWMLVFILMVMGGVCVMMGAVQRKRSMFAEKPKLEHVKPYTPPEPSGEPTKHAKFEVVESTGEETEKGLPETAAESVTAPEDGGTAAPEAEDEATGEQEDGEGDERAEDEPQREEGYAYLECPACSREFRLKLENITRRRVHIQCPHCGADGYLNADSLSDL